MAEGTKQDPWLLKTAPGSSNYSMYKDPDADPPVLVCQVGPSEGCGFMLASDHRGAQASTAASR